MNRLAKAVEAGAVWGMRQGLVPGLKWVAALFGKTIPLMPVLRTAYLGFAYTVLVAIWVKARGEKLSDFGLCIPRQWLRAIGWGVGFFVLVVAYAIVLEPMLDLVLEPFFGPSRGADTFRDQVRGNTGMFLFVLPAIWIIAALGEEFLYRGFIMTRLTQAFGENRIGFTCALLVQAMLFGLGHLYQGWTGVIGVTIYGIFYGLAARVMGRNLLPAIIVHGLLDTLGFTLLYVGAM